LPHWFEVDLGTPRLLRRIVVSWLDEGNRALDYCVEGKLRRGDSYAVLASAEGSQLLDVLHGFEPRRVRLLRVTVSRCEGQQRLLMRHFRAFHGHPNEADRTGSSKRSWWKQIAALPAGKVVSRISAPALAARLALLRRRSPQG